MNKIIFLLGLLFSACADRYPKADSMTMFRALVHPEIIAGFDFKLPAKSIVNQKDLDRYPPLTWSPVVAWRVFENETSTPVTFCMFYLIPQLKGAFVQKGILKVIRAEDTQSCDNLYVRDAHALIRNITKLSMKISSFTMQVEGNNGKDFSFEFPMYNLMRGSLSGDTLKKREFRRNNPSTPATRIVGVTPRYPGATGAINESKKDFLLGSISDSYPDNTLVVCKEVDQNCKINQKDFCDQCRFGWFEVSGPDCGARGATRYCSPFKCGEKGWPACHRGFVFEEDGGEKGCVDKSISGFCKKGLIPYCEGKNVLVCR